MTPLGTLVFILCTAVPLGALCIFDRRWQYWLLPLIPLPLVGEVFRHFLDPIYMRAFTAPPAPAAGNRPFAPAGEVS